MPPVDDSDPAESDLFSSTEAYYAEYRPGYGDATVDYLVERFDLDESARVLDLGCGAGQIAVPLAERVDDVVGMDPNEEMLRRAELAAEAAGLENVEWVVGSDADLDELSGPFDLTTMGRSFHWMDQAATLAELKRLTAPGGGIALLGDAEWLTRGTKDWQDTVYDIADEYLVDLPSRTGPVEYDDPWDELIADHGFTDVEVERRAFQREWDVDGVVGYVFSLSFASPQVFGDDKAAFEAELCRRLGEYDRETFVQDVDLKIITGTV